MLVAKRLFLWHQAKEAEKRALEALRELEREGADLQAKVNSLEEELLSMPPAADAEQEIARLLKEQELWMAKNERARFAEICDQRKLDLMQSLQECEAIVNEHQRHLDPGVLAAYDRVAREKRQPIVEVKRKSCMGCFLPLSLAKLEEWRRAKGLVFCDECGRILV